LVADRILERISIGPRNGEHSACWLWTGSSNGRYGQISVNGSIQTVHRVAYEIWIGPIGDDTVHHKCAVSLCVNPEHLQRISERENIAEMHERDSYKRRIATLESKCADALKMIASLERQIRLLTT
jgi:hypothetical protein